LQFYCVWVVDTRSVKTAYVNPNLHGLLLHPILRSRGWGAVSHLYNFLSRACRTKLFGWGYCLLILNFSNHKLGDDVVAQIDDVTYLVKNDFFSFTQVFITILKYMVCFDHIKVIS